MKRLLVLGLCMCLGGPCFGGLVDAEFELDTTSQWNDALTSGRLTAVNSWVDYRMEELFPGLSSALVEPTLYAGIDELIAEFAPGVEGEEEVFGLSYNYPEDPDLSKKTIIMRKAEIEKLTEFWIVLTDELGKIKKARIKSDNSGKEIDVDFPGGAMTKSDLVVKNGTCEELWIELGFDITKVKKGTGGIYTAKKKTKKSTVNLMKYKKLAVIPEPATVALLALGSLVLVQRRRLS